MEHPITSILFDMKIFLLQPCLMMSEGARYMMERARQRGHRAVTAAFVVLHRLWLQWSTEDRRRVWLLVHEKRPSPRASRYRPADMV